jgi:hypothetical protein
MEVHFPINQQIICPMFSKYNKGGEHLKRLDNTITKEEEDEDSD